MLIPSTLFNISAILVPGIDFIFSFDKIILVEIMKQITKFGTKTIIASHDLNFIKQITNDCLMIKDGYVLNFGPSNKIINKKNIENLFDLEILPTWSIK